MPGARTSSFVGSDTFSGAHVNEWPYNRAADFSIASDGKLLYLGVTSWRVLEASGINTYGVYTYIKLHATCHSMLGPLLGHNGNCLLH